MSEAATSRLFDRLAGPDGLTATASTFTRPDVLVALGAGLAGAGRTELEGLADWFLAERAVSVVADRQYRQVVRALAWQRRATGVAIEVDHPGYVLEALGPVPESTRGRRAWRHAAAEIGQYRRSYYITDPERALGPEPRDPAQRAGRQRARIAIDRVHAKQHATDRSQQRQSTSEPGDQPRPHQQRGRPGPERAAG